MNISKSVKLKILFFICFFVCVNNLLKSQDCYDESYQSFDLISFTTTKINNQKKISLENFSLGVSFGINFSQVIPYQRNSIFSASDNGAFEKDYGIIFKNIGSQMGFKLDYEITKIISIGIHPIMTDFTYRYKNLYQWSGNTNLQYEASIAHKLSSFEIPLVLSFHTTFKKWQPYYQGGAFYGLLKYARTEISVIETSSNLLGSSQTLSYSTVVSSTDQYAKRQYGLLAGAGIAYLGAGVKLGIEANLHFFLSNLNSTESRYQNNVVVSGNYDVPDKFKLTNLAINLIIGVPLVCKNQNSKNGSPFCN